MNITAGSVVHNMASLYRFCGNCGAEYVSDDDRFCRICGIPIESFSDPRILPSMSDSPVSRPKESRLRLVFSDIFSDARLPRLRFFLYWLALWICGFILAFVIGLIYYGAGGQDDEGFESGLTVIGLLFGVPVIAWLARRRFHDMDRSGWWCLAMIVPVVHLVTWAILFFGKGTDGPNDYGPKPSADRDQP